MGKYPRCFVLLWLLHVRPVENFLRERKLKESCKAVKLVNIEDLPSGVSPQLFNCVGYKIPIFNMSNSISRPRLDRPTTFIDELPASWNPEECSEKIVFSCITFFWIQEKAFWEIRCSKLGDYRGRYFHAFTPTSQGSRTALSWTITQRVVVIPYLFLKCRTVELERVFVHVENVCQFK